MRACDAIERSTKRQVDLIDDLLDVSRIVTGKMRVDLLPVDMAAVIESAIDSVAPQAASKPIQITQSLDRSMGPVRGDRVRLEQVISNLLTNAIKFTPPKGNVHVSLVEAGGLAHLTVTDDGMGIEEALLPRIFDRLMQKDSSSTRAHAGLGLGLAIVRHLIDLHGGTVGAESGGAGVGATFRITLPLLGTLPQRVPTVPSTLPPPHSRPFVGQVREPRSVDAGSLVGRRILVVEDDTGIREALTEMLTWAGAVVRAAESAAAGMMTFEEFRPDALICDIAMPGEDGYAFIGRIRSLGAGSGGETPALALTALAGDAARQRAFSEGFQMHLTKPVDIQRLTSAVTELLSH